MPKRQRGPQAPLLPSLEIGPYLLLLELEDGATGVTVVA